MSSRDLGDKEVLSKDYEEIKILRVKVVNSRSLEVLTLIQLHIDTLLDEYLIYSQENKLGPLTPVRTQIKKSESNSIPDKITYEDNQHT